MKTIDSLLKIIPNKRLKLIKILIKSNSVTSIRKLGQNKQLGKRSYHLIKKDLEDLLKLGVVKKSEMTWVTGKNKAKLKGEGYIINRESLFYDMLVREALI